MLDAWHSEKSGVLRMAKGRPTTTVFGVEVGFEGNDEVEPVAAEAKRLIFS